MKKLLYNPWIKAAAAILCLACIFFSSILILSTALNVGQDTQLWRAAFEENDIEYEIYDAISAIDIVNSDDKTIVESVVDNRIGNHFDYFITYPVRTKETPVEAFGEYMIQAGRNAEEASDETYGEYLIETNQDTENVSPESSSSISGYRQMSNTDERSAEYFKNARYFAVINNDMMSASRSMGYSDKVFKELQKDGFEIYIAVKPEYLEKVGKLRLELENIIFELLMLLFTALLCFVYLLIVCGRNSDRELRMFGIDKMFIELNLGFIAITAAAAFLIFGIGFFYYVDGGGTEERIFSNNSAFTLIFAVSFAVTLMSAAFGALLMSIVRNLKNKTFASRSLTARIIKFIIKYVKKATEYFKEMLRAVGKLCTKSAGAALIAGLLIYTFALVFSTLLENPVLVIIVAFAGIALSAKSVMNILKIKDGIFEIQKGNIDYKITGVEKGVTGAVAAAVNNIGEGLASSVNERLKAERMKVELITNVSHDLKTPLTSIISYTDLLLQTDLSPSEANDYVAIIKQKGERLKNLTSDLFDISKVQSGNEHIELEKLDLSLLIRQTLGELDKLTAESGLEFVLKLADDAFVLADGKKMSRVFENLVSNILKYSMPNTRVYISAERSGDGIRAELKNISAYPLDFDPEEITGRFVRGDTSRSTEGNGLGLAIAKSYTEACGGQFEIKTDGDLFKAVIKFPDIN